MLHRVRRFFAILLISAYIACYLGYHAVRWAFKILTTLVTWLMGLGIFFVGFPIHLLCELGDAVADAWSYSKWSASFPVAYRSRAPYPKHSGFEEMMELA